MNLDRPGGAYWRRNRIIPADWTPEQALAVFEMIDQLRDQIWHEYHQGIQGTLRQSDWTDPVPAADPRQLPLFPDLPPF